MVVAVGGRGRAQLQAAGRRSRSDQSRLDDRVERCDRTATGLYSRGDSAMSGCMPSDGEVMLSRRRDAHKGARYVQDDGDVGVAVVRSRYCDRRGGARRDA